MLYVPTAASYKHCRRNRFWELSKQTILNILKESNQCWGFHSQTAGKKQQNLIEQYHK